MDGRKNSALVWTALGAAAVLVLGAGAGLTVAYSGLYNVAATEEHVSVTRWAFDTTFRNSVERRAAALTLPADVTPADLEHGGRAYKAMCEHCHAGPGTGRAEWAQGMRPLPPHLTEAAAEWEIEEVFWLVKHGAKMTGMPAFGPTHDDEAIWRIAAFVKQLPAMPADRYAALPAAHGSDGQAGAHSH